MLDKEIDKLMEQKIRDENIQEGKKVAQRRRDEVDEAGDSSFPASDPPAFTSAAPRKAVKYAKSPKRG